MTEETPTEKFESLGEYLRRLRIEKNAEFEDVQQETKIPAKALRAMEADDYATLPADAFARGFYSLYAKFLEIDSKELLERFEKERTAKPGQGKYSSPLRQEKQVNTMAARPSMMTGSFLGFGLVVIIAFTALVCWYFSWNPAKFLSEQLRSLQQVPTLEEQTGNSSSDAPSAAASKTEVTETVTDSKFFLTIDFQEDTTITTSTDNSVPEEGLYSKGSTRSWYANNKISVILPESANVELYFNGFQIELPQPSNGLISLTLP